MTEQEKNEIVNEIMTRLKANSVDYSAASIRVDGSYAEQVNQRDMIKIPAIDTSKNPKVYGNIDLTHLLEIYGLSQAKKAVHDAEAVGDIAEGEIETAKNNALSDISSASDSEQSEISSLADIKKNELNAIVATGIKDIQQTTTSTDDDGNNVITVTLTNGQTFTFTVQNGSKGSKGDKGDKGEKGDTGDVSNVTKLSTVDSRNANEAPSYYMSNLSKTFYTEFKSAQAIGLSAQVGAVYVFLITMTPWHDNSGGSPIQLAFHDSFGMFMRGAASDSAWGSWKKIYSAGESKNMSANWTASQDSSGNLVFTYG